MKQVLTSAIRGYQLAIRPMLGANCRFFPSCSDYAREAIERHGAAKGAYLAARRIGRCHPFHPGGYDPVPCVSTDSPPGRSPSAVGQMRPPRWTRNV